MDENALGAIGIVVMIVGGLGVVAGATVGSLYATDSVIGATVIDKRCGSNPLGATSVLVVRTEMPVPGIKKTLTEVDNAICVAIRDGDNGNYGEYRLRSEHTRIFESKDGDCLWDNQAGLC